MPFLLHLPEMPLSISLSPNITFLLYLPQIPPNYSFISQHAPEILLFLLYPRVHFSLFPNMPLTCMPCWEIPPCISSFPRNALNAWNTPTYFSYLPQIPSQLLVWKVTIYWCPMSILGGIWKNSKYQVNGISQTYVKVICVCIREIEPNIFSLTLVMLQLT